METMQSLQAKMRQFGIRNRFFGMAELRNLPRLLVKDEYVEEMLFGWYEGGPAIMVATNYRVLLVDKAPGVLLSEDFPYDMIAEVEHATGLLRTHLTLFAKSKQFKFSSLSNKKVRRFARFIDNKIYELRRTGQYMQLTPEQRDRDFVWRKPIKRSQI